MNNEAQNRGNVDDNILIGVDVGTASARAGVFDAEGEMLATAKRDISLFYGDGQAVEQSSRDIWQAVCDAVKEALGLAGVKPGQVAGIGFDAT
ncbi:FGGY family carbohydrate kinase, partial [Cronobacter sakazakii]